VIILDQQEGYIGRQIGEYRLVSKLGGGGFGTVYLAEHVHDHTQAAVKVLNISLNEHEDLRTFLNEARTIRLCHQHIISLLDFGLTRENTPYLVMEYAEGGTLQQRCPKGTKLPFETLDSYVTQLASALQYAHNHRVIHRDVKPANVLVRADGTLLLSDFGIAKVLEQSSFVNSQTLIGTPAYMAPEQSQGKPCPASDQYSLAVMVYGWLAGRLPFQGSPLEVMLQHRVDTPPSLQALHPGIPVQVEQVILQALAKTPEGRFSTVEEFAQALHTTFQTLAPILQETPPDDQPSSVALSAVSSHTHEVLSLSSRSTAINSALPDISLLQTDGLPDTALPPKLSVASPHSPEEPLAPPDQMQMPLLRQLASSAQVQETGGKKQESHSQQPPAPENHLPMIQGSQDHSSQNNSAPAETMISRFSNKRFIRYGLLGTLLCLTLLMGLPWVKALPSLKSQPLVAPSHVTKDPQQSPTPNERDTSPMPETSPMTGTSPMTISSAISPAGTSDTKFTLVTPSPTITPISGATVTPTVAVSQPKPTPTPTPTPKRACPPTVQDGSTGSWVKVLQQELNARGMKDQDGKALVVDGSFGPRTRYAVESWQKHARIQVDGIVGPITWHTLGKC
jgi:serine/threonine protein kinase